MAVVSESQLKARVALHRGLLLPPLLPEDMVAEEEDKPVSIFDFEKICEKSLETEGREEWVAWRESLGKGTIFGSAFPIWLGEGHQSLNQLHQTLHGHVEKPETNHFVQSAMDHGSKHEAAALKIFVRALKDRHPEQNILAFDNIPSSLYRHTTVKDLHLLMTPDCVMIVRNTGGAIRNVAVAEVKCPYHQRSQFDSVEDWVDNFVSGEKHPMGYAHAFWQAALYGSVDPNCTKVYTVFYFLHEDTNKDSLVVREFEVTDELRSFIMTNIRAFSQCLSDSNKRKLRVPSTRVKKAKRLMASCYRGGFIVPPAFITYSDGGESAPLQEDGEQ